MTAQLKPARVDGFPLECWNERDDATIVNHTVAGSAENLAVPSGAMVCRLVATADFWYAYDATAAVPTDDSDTSSLFLPSGAERWVQCNNVTNISIIGTGFVNAVFWG